MIYSVISLQSQNKCLVCVSANRRRNDKLYNPIEEKSNLNVLKESTSDVSVHIDEPLLLHQFGQRTAL